MATTQKRGHDMGSIVKGKNGVLRFYWTDAKEKVWQSHFFTWEGEGDSESGSAARQAQFAGEQKAPAGQCRTGATQEVVRKGICGYCDHHTCVISPQIPL